LDLLKQHCQGSPANRITGKRGAATNLTRQSLKASEHRWAASLELLFLGFAAGQDLQVVNFDTALLGSLPESARLTVSTVLGLWNLREGREMEAKRFLKDALSGRKSREPQDFYRALPLGILCFALGEGAHGQLWFDLAKTEPLPHEGYPFVSLTADFDRTFVNVCIGQNTRDLPERRIRELRGHAWLLFKYIDLMRQNSLAFSTLVNLSLKWKNPLNEKSIADRLLQFQKKLIASSGPPLWS
jgi:hypothetical protein